MPSLLLPLLLLPLLLLPLVLSFSSPPCSDFGGNLGAEIRCLRSLLSQCSSTVPHSRETRKSHPSATLSRALPASAEGWTPVDDSSTLPPSTPLPPPLPTPARSYRKPDRSYRRRNYSSTTTTTTSTTTTPPPTTSTTPPPISTSTPPPTSSLPEEEEWPTPSTALIVDSLRYELSRDFERRFRELQGKLDERLAVHSVQVDSDVRKINKVIRLLRTRVWRRGSIEYMVPEDRDNWYSAQEVCVEWGGNLASVSDAAENEFIRGLLPSHDSAWLSLNDVQHEDTFVNTDGTKSVYRNWAAGEPDNHAYNENCAEMIHSTGEWLDSLCILTKRFVCKRT